MNTRFAPLLALLLGLLAVPTSGLHAQEPAAHSASQPTKAAIEAPPGSEDDEELEWMLEGLLLAADGIGMEPGALYSALMHDLSIAEVARAHGVMPLDLFDVAVSFEESEILDEILEEQLAHEQAAEWRDAAAEDVAWMLYAKDPFGLADIAWLLDGASDALDIDVLELSAWLDDGASLAEIALQLEMDPMEVSVAAEAYLEMELETMVLLEEIDGSEADEWRMWNLAWLPDLMQDDALFETLAVEAWMEEIVELLAEMLAIDAVDVWGHLEEGASIHDLFEAFEVDFGQAAADFELEPGVVRAMITELEAWLYEDADEEENAEGRTDF